MGRPTGFIEIQRRGQPARPPLERIHDWSEAHPRLSDGELADQGARCMDCGIPFCHTGVLISGMASGCPINNLIPEWNDLVYRGQWREASIRLHRTNNFPEFTGRVCPAPCEGSCTVGLERRAGGDQDDRAGDRRPGLGRGLDHRRRRRSPAPGTGSRSSAPVPRACRRPTSSTRPATT